MDLSTGGDIKQTRQEILAMSEVPLGTVPLYQATVEVLRKNQAIVDLTVEGLPSIEDVEEGVIATKIAAHAADVAKGLPQAKDRDSKMARAGKNLDWEQQLVLRSWL